MKIEGARSDGLDLERTSSMSDIVESYISVTDITQYIYCPRVVYFDKVLHSPRILGSQQADSRAAHVRLQEKEKRRIAAKYYSQEFNEADKQFSVPLESKTLRLRGLLDLLIQASDEYIPVEYKYMLSSRGKIWPDHKYQLAAYALLLDENYKTTVKRGYLNYVNEDLVLRCDIPDASKRYTRRLVEEICELVTSQRIPPVTVPISRCTGGCGFRWICQRK